MTFHRIAVIGAGHMGSGIAQAVARHGLEVVVSDADDATTAAAVERIHHQAERHRADRLLSDADVTAIRQHVRGGSLDDAAGGAELVIEAVTEDLDTKRQVLTAVGRAAPDSAVIATNSSSLGRAHLADTVPQPFVVMHWFNPAPFLPLVELAGDDPVVERVASWLRGIGKQPVVVPDIAGFLGNRLQFALFREAALIVEEGLATAAEVDEVVTASFGRPPGLDDHSDAPAAEPPGPVTRRPRLIHLNGPAGIGKSTLAARWAADHPLTLNCEVDVLRGMISGGQHLPAAMGVSRTTAIALLTAHLSAGHDVVLPQLVARRDQLERFATAAARAGADYVEVMLLDASDDPDAAVARFHRRGDDGWHREVRDLVADQGGDEMLRTRYAALCELVRDRPDAIVLSSVEGDPDGTYRRLRSAVDAHRPG